MQCPRCHNQDARYFYNLNSELYCRKCISFHRVFVNQLRLTKSLEFPKNHYIYSLDFNLSFEQATLSHRLVENYQHHQDSLVWAVCGSGKTEIIFELIQYALSIGQRICFCIPRKELVVELYQRINESFRDVDIGLLYGGCCQNPNAQFVICTMHQLYRFENNDGFNLMIADEVDAFPFYQNEVLNEIFNRCCLGNFVKLSATFSEKDIKQEQLLIMSRRYHGYDLPVPLVKKSPTCIHLWYLLYLIRKLNKKTLVYVPTRSDVTYLSHYLSKHHFRVGGVSSTTKDNQTIINALKNGELDVIVTTTLLERGITIEDVQVIVYHADHILFDERTLVQISGRVGRKPNHPTGYIYFLASSKTKGMKDCIKTIRKLNAMNV